jgi:hypothetical protein
MTSVVVFGWPKEPIVEAMRSPRGSRVSIFIDDGFGAGGTIGY